MRNDTMAAIQKIADDLSSQGYGMSTVEDCLDAIVRLIETLVLDEQMKRRGIQDIAE